MNAKDVNKLKSEMTTHEFAETETAADLKQQGLDPYGVAMRRALQSVDDDQKTPGGGFASIYQQKLNLLRAAASKPNLTEKEMKSIAIALLI